MANCMEIRCMEAPKPLCYKGQCYKKCPTSTFANSSVCISGEDCHKAGWMTWNNTCIKDCPSTSPFHNPGLVNNTDCIDEEQCWGAGRVIYNNKCLKDCPFGTGNYPLEQNRYCLIFETEAYIAGVSAFCLLFVTLSCICLLHNPKKTRTRIEQPAEDLEQLLHQDPDQTTVMRGARSALESSSGRQPINHADTHLKEVAGWEQPIDGHDTSVKMIRSCDDDSEDFVSGRPYVAGCIEQTDDNEDFVSGRPYLAGHIEQFDDFEDFVSSRPKQANRIGQNDDSEEFVPSLPYLVGRVEPNAKSSLPSWSC